MRALATASFLALCLTSGGGAASTMDGLSASTAATSAKQLTADFPAAVDGVYWADPDGPGGNAAFETFFDLSSFGGGWTLGAEFTPNDAFSALSLSDFVGTPFTSSSWSVDLSALVLNREADYLYVTSTTTDPSAGVGASFVETGKTYSDPLADLIANCTNCNGGLESVGVRVFVREAITPTYAPVPLPLPAALLLSGFGLLALIKRRRL